MISVKQLTEAERKRCGTNPDDAIFGTGREVLAVRAKRHRANVVVGFGIRRLVKQGPVAARTRSAPGKTDHVHRRNTHAILAPVLVSYSVVFRLQPVASTLPSGEKRTQQTTLIRRMQVSGCAPGHTRGKREDPRIVHEGVDQADVEHALDVRVEHGHPVRTFLLEILGRRLGVETRRRGRRHLGREFLLLDGGGGGSRTGRGSLGDTGGRSDRRSRRAR